MSYNRYCIIRQCIEIAFLLFLPSVSIAQNNSLHGKVLDPKQYPIAYATVVVSADSLLTQDIRYAITNNDGEFEVQQINKSSSALWLSIRSVGYVPYMHRFARHDFPSSLTVTLPELNVGVEDVVILAQAPDMYEKGDTIVYNPKSYTRGNERNVGEVIDQMPGMKVDKNGKVYFQGKEVDKILVNNEDIFSKSTSGIAINTLPPDFASSIELLQNYQSDDDIASEFRNDKLTALNLKSERRFSFSGSAEGGGGLINKFEGKASLLSLLPKGSASALLNSNNTGASVFSIEDYFMQVADIESLLSGKGDNVMRLSPEENELINPPSNEYLRTSGLANLNATLKPSKYYKLKSSTLYNRSRAYGVRNSLQRFFDVWDSFRNYHQSTEQKDIQFFSQSLTNQWLPNRRFSLQSETKFVISDLGNSLEYTNHYLNRTLDARYKSGKRNYEVKEDLEAQWLLGQGVLFLGAKVALNNLTNSNALLSSAAVLPFAYESDGIWYGLRPQREKQDIDYRAYVGTVYPLFWGIYLTSELAYQGTLTRLVQEIDLSREREDLHLHTLQPYLGLMKNISIFRFTVGSYFSFHQLKTSPKSLDRYTFTYLEPKASLTIAFTSYHRLTFTAQETHRFNEIERFTRMPWVVSYQEYSMPSQLAIPFVLERNLNMQYSYVSLFNNFMFLGYTSYVRQANKAQSVIETHDLVSKLHYVDGGSSYRFYGSIHLSKGLGSLPMDAKVSVNYHSSVESTRYNNEQGGTLSNDLLNADIGFFSRFRHTFVNFGVQGKYTRDAGRFSAQHAITSIDEEVTGRASLQLRRGKFQAAVAGYYSFAKEKEFERDVYDFDVTMSYRLGNSDLSLRGEKLLHLRVNEWWQSSSKVGVYSRTLYRRIAGHLLLSLRVKF